MLTFSHPGSRIQGSKRHPIPDPGSGSATLETSLEKMSIWYHVQAEQTEGGVTEGGEDQDGAEARGSEENEKSRRPGSIQFTSMFEHVGTVLYFVIKSLRLPMPLG